MPILGEPLESFLNTTPQLEMLTLFYFMCLVLKIKNEYLNGPSGINLGLIVD
jgi:hypothetical protein